MALIDPKDAENIYNESGWAARRKEAREWRDATRPSRRDDDALRDAADSHEQIDASVC
jgi:hypothetical protein